MQQVHIYVQHKSIASLPGWKQTLRSTLGNHQEDKNSEACGNARFRGSGQLQEIGPDLPI